MAHTIHPGIKALITHEDTFLIIKQAVGDYVFWDLPGGRILYGDNPLETLAREVKEETGLAITIKKPAGMWWLYRVYDSDQMVYMTYMCTTKTPKNIDLSKNSDRSECITEYAWVTKEAFLSGDYPPAHESLLELIAYVL